MNTSFTRNMTKPNAPIISVYKTNMISKRKLDFSGYTVNNVLKNSQVNTFELDVIRKLLFFADR